MLSQSSVGRFLLVVYGHCIYYAEPFLFNISHSFCAFRSSSFPTAAPHSWATFFFVFVCQTQNSMNNTCSLASIFSLWSYFQRNLNHLFVCVRLLTQRLFVLALNVRKHHKAGGINFKPFTTLHRSRLGKLFNAHHLWGEVEVKIEIVWYL